MRTGAPSDFLYFGSAAGMIEVSVCHNNKANRELVGRDLPDDSKNIVSRIDYHGVVCSFESENVTVGLVGPDHNLPEHTAILPFKFGTDGA